MISDVIKEEVNICNKNVGKVCMIVQNPMVKGGIAAVVNGYRNSQLEKDFDILYVESYKDGNKITKLIKGICGYCHFTKVLIIDKPDLIHMHSSFGPSFYRSLPFIWMANYAKKPIINHCHGADFDDFYSNANSIKKKLIRKAYDKCSMIIALSNEWKENISEIVSVNKITVIENYSIIHKEEYNKKKTKSEKCNNQVLFLGAIGQRKGCYDIPAVVEQVVKEIPDCKFVIAGDGEIDQIKTLLKEKGVEKNVIFPGWIRDEKKDNLLRESDIFFLPSYNEGMPMSILDAMGYGLPVVSTNVGGIPKIVHNGENGFTYEPGDVDGFAKSIIFYLKNEDILHTSGNMSLNIVNQGFSLKRHLENLKECYNKIIVR